MDDEERDLELAEDEEAPKLIDPRCIAAVGDIARLFMVGKTTAAQWYARRDRNGYPEAIAYISCGALFDLNEVIEWYGNYHPLKGGRPGSMPADRRVS
jgi:hypothetical protein